MQVHEGECKKGDVLSLNILEGRASEELMRLLLTHGIEIEIAAIQGDTVRLIVRAPAKMLIVEELVAPP
ncbi:carbon storage regulator [Pseudomonas resinovorans]|uniref:Carbon storage regulator n=1 Tax=Metapseudomonas resinovorans TaxID=53412 RepID=A0ABT4YBQ2_METRE|nr:carbon storage regulator [Pseudomonas resinovorans]MDA8485965.1 carbon storage regulator [Pseudomonas resinovorans]